MEGKHIFVCRKHNHRSISDSFEDMDTCTECVKEMQQGTEDDLIALPDWNAYVDENGNHIYKDPVEEFNDVGVGNVSEVTIK